MTNDFKKMVKTENRLNHRRKALLIRDSLVMASTLIFMIIVFLIALHIGYVKICF